VRWNNIANPNLIEVGQVLRVREPSAAVASLVPGPEGSAPGGAVVTPYQGAPAVEGRDMGSPSAPRPLAPEKPPASSADAARDSGVVSTPRAVKVPYSDAALAKLRAAAPESTPSVAVAPPTASTPPAAPAVRADAPRPEPPRTESAAASDDADAVAWGWPAAGKVIANFNENGGPKGVQIAGELGQPVLASAGGRVVYTGSGLRGYGNLVIIKHNNTYLSAYAHNRSVLVKQGDNVAKGQKIAEMGNSDASRVMLHFEIRRLGKPVDPMRFLPPA
jgi:lipoprotein NlpD